MSVRVDPAAGTAPARVVVIGCGAVTRLYAGPALARLERAGVVEVLAVHDPDGGAMEAVRQILPRAAAAGQLGDALSRGADLAAVLSPPRFHAEQSILAMRAGLDVFCEKPMAASPGEADAMLAASRETGRRLAIGLVRRRFPATQAIRRLVGAGTIGRPVSVSWFEGGPFDWPIASPRAFDRAEGGGVLQDIGTHVLDLMSWWFGPPTVIAYRDDAMGGVEANCAVDLDFDGLPGRLRLSRDWARPNLAVITGSEGRIVWTANDTERLTLTLGGSAPVVLDAVAEEAPDFVGCYARQFADVVEARRQERPLAVPPEAARDALRLVADCYARRAPMDMPWLSADLEPLPAGEAA